MPQRAQSKMSRTLFAAHGVEVVAPPPFPIERLIIGKSVDHAIEILPRIFNLCKSAQTLAVKVACGRSIDDGEVQALHSDILREHKVWLQVLLPAKLGQEPSALPIVAPDMSLDDACVRAPLLQAIRQRFASGEAVVKAGRPENSVAARQANVPLMQEIEAQFGCGPLWRVAARFCEVYGDALPQPEVRNGWAQVPAARGAYRVRATVVEGKIATFVRHTPTDDMLQVGGAVSQSLTRLKTPDLAPLVIEILDPCVPLEVRQVHHA